MPDSITLRLCLQRCTLEMGQISGPSTNRYSDELMRQNVEHAFKHVFREAFWPRYSSYAQFTLDGTTGLVTDDLTILIKDVKDIDAVWVANHSSGLPLLPTTVNPYALSGTRPRFVELTNSDKVFRIWPRTATGQVTVRYRTLPTLPFDLDDTIYVNDMVLVYATCWWTFDKDGDNPGAAKLMQGLLLDTLKTEKRLLLNLPLAHNDSAGSIPLQWFMAP